MEQLSYFISPLALRLNHLDHKVKVAYHCWRLLSFLILLSFCQDCGEHWHCFAEIPMTQYLIDMIMPDLRHLKC